MTQTIRELLVNEIEKAFPPKSFVHVATSAGIDSSALVIAVKDAGMNPIITSFTLNDRESTDFKGAKKLANYFNLEFVPVYVPTDKETIIGSVMANMFHYHFKKKADVECMYPFINMIQHLHKLGAKNLLNGLGADSHFCLSKKGMIHYKHTKKLFQQFRKEYFYGKENLQVTMLPIICRKYGIKISTPVWEQSIYDLFSDSTWDELNKPRQKEPIRSAFPELTPLKLKNHTNLQLGDSGIAETVGEIMRKEFTPRAKSPVSAYNYMWKYLETLSKGTPYKYKKLL